MRGVGLNGGRFDICFFVCRSENILMVQFSLFVFVRVDVAGGGGGGGSLSRFYPNYCCAVESVILKSVS